MFDDCRSGLRQIRRNPGLAAATILTLALGVGATTAVFTLADPMLFRMLPYHDAGRLFSIRVIDNGSPNLLQVPDYVRLEASHTLFEGVADFRLLAVGRLPGRGENTIGYGVTPQFLDTLGIRPILGRGFLAEEHRPGEQPERVALITYGLWQSQYGGAQDVLGRMVELQGPPVEQYRVIGVLGKDFVFPDHTNQSLAFLLPTAADPHESSPFRLAGAIVRLAPGATRDAAIAEVQAIVTAVERNYPKFPQGRRVELVPLQEALFGRARTPLLMLLAATGCVLLLACANLAHLFLARLHARRRELGIRLAIGAGPWRLARLLFIEAMVLAVAGAVAALVVGQRLFAAIMAWTPKYAHVYRLLPASLDWRVAAFAAVLVAGALMVFGLAPALRASRANLRESLQLADAGGHGRAIRSDATLIFMQSAVAIALLVTSVLIVGSFVRLTSQPLGFEPDRVRMVSVEFMEGRDASGEMTNPVQARRGIYQHLSERLPVPAALAGGLPGQTLWGGLVRADAPPDTRAAVTAYPSTDTFFQTFGLRLMRGRLFDEQEAFSNAPVAVLDQRAAATLWRGEEPLGRQVRQGDGVVRTVIGVVQTLRTRLTTDQGGGCAFVPIAACTRPPSVAFRVGDAEIPVAWIRAVVQQVAPGAVVDVWPFKPFERTVGQPRFLAVLLGALGMLTITLTIVGVFGVVNHVVARTTHEVGIRMALGADAARIRLMVLRRALLPAALGVGVGVGASLLWTQTLRALLFGLQPTDPAAFVGSAVLVLTLVAIASLTPAWRASRVDPTVALRSE